MEWALEVSIRLTEEVLNQDENKRLPVFSNSINQRQLQNGDLA